jgi:hypothetical protein
MTRIGEPLRIVIAEPEPEPMEVPGIPAPEPQIVPQEEPVLVPTK